MSAAPYPVAYVRKSTKGGTDSRADQIAGARELASRHGDVADLVVLDGDWAISASREKTARRLDFARLMADVEAGKVSALYATDADRLARSVQWAARLGDACKDHGVLIYTPVKTFDLSDEGDWMFWSQLAIQNEYYVKQAQRKAAARVTRTRERGGRMGQKPYGEGPGEDAQVVVDAFREAGSYHGAARLLTERGVKSRRGHLTTDDGQLMGWEASTIKRVLERVAPELVPVRKSPGSRTVTIRRFTRLLRCPCGANMTPQYGKGRSLAYICRVGHRSPEGQHPRPWVVREHRIEAAVREATSMLFTVSARTVRDDGTEASIADLEARLERFAMLYGEGSIRTETWEARRDSLNADIERLKSQNHARLTFHLGIDWNAPDGAVNARLRELVDRIELDYVEVTGPLKGRHSGLTTTLVPAAIVWRIQPTVEVEGSVDGDVMPDPDAEPVEGGWRVRVDGVTPVKKARRSRPKVVAS